MKYNVSFEGVQRGGAIPAGHYAGVVADVVIKQKEGSEYPYLNWDVVVAEGEYEGRHQFGITTLKPAGLFNLMDYLQALGFTEQDYDLQFDDATGQLTSPEVIGLPCTMSIIEETYNNKPTSKIDTLLPVNAEEPQEAAPAPRPATKAAPAAAAKNGPAPAAKRSPFPAAAAGARQFKR